MFWVRERTVSYKAYKGLALSPDGSLVIIDHNGQSRDILFSMMFCFYVDMCRYQ